MFARNWKSSDYKLPKLTKCLQQGLGSTVDRLSGRFSSSPYALYSPSKPYCTLAARFAAPLGPPWVSRAPYIGTCDTHLWLGWETPAAWSRASRFSPASSLSYCAKLSKRD